MNWEVGQYPLIKFKGTAPFRIVSWIRMAHTTFFKPG